MQGHMCICMRDMRFLWSNLSPGLFIMSMPTSVNDNDDTRWTVHDSVGSLTIVPKWINYVHTLPFVPMKQLQNYQIKNDGVLIINWTNGWYWFLTQCLFICGMSPRLILDVYILLLRLYHKFINHTWRIMKPYQTLVDTLI